MITVISSSQPKITTPVLLILVVAGIHMIACVKVKSTFIQ